MNFRNPKIVSRFQFPRLGLLISGGLIGIHNLVAVCHIAWAYVGGPTFLRGPGSNRIWV